MKHKQTIVFIQRVLWGGGAERVVCDIAHGLDREKFEPIILYLYSQDQIHFKYDPSIKVSCVEPVMRDLIKPLNAAQENADQPLHPDQAGPKGRLWNLARAAKAAIPSERTQVFLSQTWARLNQLRHNGFKAVNDNNHSGHNTAVCGEIAELTTSIADVWPYARALHEMLGQVDPNAILVPVMEEAAVRVWLSQTLQNRPFVASLHSVESFNLPLMYPDQKKLALQRWLLGNACRAAAKVTMPSDGCCHDLTSYVGLPADDVRVMHNPVHCEGIAEMAKKIVPKFPNKKTMFVHVGRLAEDKNPLLMVEAAAVLKENYNDFVVNFLGKGPMKMQISRRIRELGLTKHVFLLGEVPNPFPYIAASRGLVLTSHVESFALVLVEAMVCGSVPIAVDCPHGPREVLDNGKYGILTEPGDAHALAEAMLRLARDDDMHQSLRDLGSQRARHYDLPRVVRQWEDLFDEMADGCQVEGASYQPRTTPGFQPSSHCK